MFAEPAPCCRTRPVPIADVIGWQELAHDRATRRLRELDGYRSFVPDSDGNQVSVSWRTDTFAFLGGGTRNTHAARAGVTPSRWITWVRLQHKATGRKVVVVNTHFIQNAYKPGQLRDWRLARWRHHRAALGAVVERQRHTGFAVIVTGDMNYRGNLHLPGLRKAAAEDGHPIDQVYASRSPLVGTGTQVQLGRFGSDHHAYRVPVTIG